MKELGGRVVGRDKSRLLSSSFDFARPAVLVMYLVTGLASKPFDRFRKRERLDLLDELINVSALSTSETVIQATAPVDRERGCLFGMERAQSFESLTPRLLQVRVAGNDIDDVGAFAQTIDIFLFDLRHYRLLFVRANKASWGSGLILAPL
jgi:hypothetical protein